MLNTSQRCDLKPLLDPPGIGPVCTNQGARVGINGLLHPGHTMSLG